MASLQPPGDSNPSIMAAQQPPEASKSINISMQKCAYGFKATSSRFQTINHGFTEASGSFQNYKYFFVKVTKCFTAIPRDCREAMHGVTTATGCHRLPQGSCEGGKFPSQPTSECHLNIIRYSIRQFIECLRSRRQRRQLVSIRNGIVSPHCVVIEQSSMSPPYRTSC